MKSPKAPQVDLTEELLPLGLTVYRCPMTGGFWIERSHYADWQAQQPEPPTLPVDIVQRLAAIDFVPPVEDNRVSLCPNTGRFLIRARIDAPKPFYVERASEDGGFWIDAGEWDVLGRLGLQAQLDVLFEADWQAKLRDVQQVDRQKQATIDKLGLELAQQVFELAEALRAHPQGDFGVAYLMQQFDRVRPS